MNSAHLQFRLTWVLCALAALLATPVALGADNDAQARYQKERAMCESGQSHQDRETCLREAGAALNQAKHGGLGDGQAQYQQNALDRCNRLPPEYRKSCLARMQGQGIMRGSVAEGGIYRELQEIEWPGSEVKAPESAR
jgi:hypothetical protein